MKKIIIFMLFSTVLFGQGLKDGRYSVQTDRSIWFWYPKTEMVVEDGVVTQVSHDRVKKDGRLASEDDWYNKKMLKKTGSNPESYSKDIPENYFKAEKNLEKMDNVAGATDSTTHFKKQMEFLLEKAKIGETGNFEMSKKDLK